MKKEYRIKKSEEFKKVLDYRHTAGKNESMSVYFAPNQYKHARFGLSVSTKLGDAVIRVRVRRQLRSMINLTGALDWPYDIVIIARPGFLNHSFQENLSLLNNALARLKPKAKGEKK